MRDTLRPAPTVVLSATTPGSGGRSCNSRIRRTRSRTVASACGGRTARLAAATKTLACAGASEYTSTAGHKRASAGRRSTSIRKAPSSNARSCTRGAQERRPATSAPGRCRRRSTLEREPRPQFRGRTRRRRWSARTRCLSTLRSGTRGDRGRRSPPRLSCSSAVVPPMRHERGRTRHQARLQDSTKSAGLREAGRQVDRLGQCPGMTPERRADVAASESPRCRYPQFLLQLGIDGIGASFQPCALSN
jgi:hypothetical protein